MLRSSRHPYQATTLPQSYLNVRNPWVEKPESSTNSSCGSRSGRTRNAVPQPGGSDWLLPRSQTLSHQGPLLNQAVQPVVVPSRGPSSALSTARESSGGVSTAGGVGSCGGQCIACETFCYYFLQVIFIAGILTGIALTIAGSVLHGNQKEGDLVVLMYIGVLLVLVCILLLSVHCCVRRNVKERKRALRMPLVDGSRRLVHPSAGDFTVIPVQDFTSDHHYRNSYTETNLNDMDVPENARSLLNQAQQHQHHPHHAHHPHSHHHQHHHSFRSTRSAGKMDPRFPEREVASSDRLPYDWGRTGHLAGVHRSFR